jgi:hypothetical protein
VSCVDCWSILLINHQSFVSSFVKRAWDSIISVVGTLSCCWYSLLSTADLFLTHPSSIYFYSGWLSLCLLGQFQFVSSQRSSSYDNNNGFWNVLVCRRYVSLGVGTFSSAIDENIFLCPLLILLDHTFKSISVCIIIALSACHQREMFCCCFLILPSDRCQFASSLCSLTVVLAIVSSNQFICVVFYQEFSNWRWHWLSVRFRLLCRRFSWAYATISNGYILCCFLIYGLFFRLISFCFLCCQRRDSLFSVFGYWGWKLLSVSFHLMFRCQRKCVETRKLSNQTNDGRISMVIDICDKIAVAIWELNVR